MDGYQVQYGVNTNQDGGVVFRPILDNMLRTIHKKPQVVVKISNITSKCSGDCNFDWSNSQIPIVQSIQGIFYFTKMILTVEIKS